MGRVNEGPKPRRCYVTGWLQVQLFNDCQPQSFHATELDLKLHATNHHTRPQLYKYKILGLVPGYQIWLGFKAGKITTGERPLILCKPNCMWNFWITGLVLLAIVDVNATLRETSVNFYGHCCLINPIVIRSSTMRTPIINIATNWSFQISYFRCNTI